MAWQKVEPTINLMTPEPGQKLALIGQNGRGKTYLAARLIAPYYKRQQIVVADVKHDPTWSQYDGITVNTIDKLTRLPFPKYPLIIFRPEGELAHDFERLDKVFAWVYKRGNTLLMIDEVSAMVPGAMGFGHGFADLLQRGRTRKCTVIMGTQRPAFVPRIVLTESQKFVLFFLTDIRDRKTVAAASHASLSQEIPDLHGFWFVDVPRGVVGYRAKL